MQGWEKMNGYVTMNSSFHRKIVKKFHRKIVKNGLAKKPILMYSAYSAPAVRLLAKLLGLGTFVDSHSSKHRQGGILL